MKIENDFFKNNIIAIINPNGTINGIKKRNGEFRHEEVFKRAEEQMPDLLDGFVQKLSISSGFDISSFVSAKGNVVFWPSSVANPEDMLISLPPKSTIEQIETTCQLLDQVKDLEIYAAISTFSEDKTSVTTKTLSTSDDPKERYDNLLNYLNKLMEIHKIEQELQKEVDKNAVVDTDVRTFIKKK